VGPHDILEETLEETLRSGPDTLARIDFFNLSSSDISWLPSSTALLGWTAYFQIDMLGLRYKSVSFGVRKYSVSANW